MIDAAEALKLLRFRLTAHPRAQRVAVPREAVEQACAALALAIAEVDWPAAWTAVLEERRRQVAAEGWTPEHDDAHEDGALALAASLYAFQAHEDGAHRHGLALARRGTCPYQWPWAADWWKPTDRRRDLVKAGALILAEIERLDRASRASDEIAEWDGEGFCPTCQGDGCDPEGGCRYDD